MRFYDGKVIAYLDITSSPKAYEVKINPNTLFKRLAVIGGNMVHCCNGIRVGC